MEWLLHAIFPGGEKASVRGVPTACCSLVATYGAREAVICYDAKLWNVELEGGERNW